MSDPGPRGARVLEHLNIEEAIDVTQCVIDGGCGLRGAVVVVVVVSGRVVVVSGRVVVVSGRVVVVSGRVVVVPDAVVIVTGIVVVPKVLTGKRDICNIISAAWCGLSTCSEQEDKCKREPLRLR